MLTTTVDSQTVILEALRYLAARCDGAEAQDGQGFNKPDSWRGRQLSERMFLSEEETTEALKMLKKYEAGQLAEAKIVLPTIERAVEQARDGEQRVGKIDYQSDMLVVTFPYLPRLVGKVKQVKGAKWNQPVAGAWNVPLKAGKDLLEAFPKFQVSEAAQKALDAYQPPAVEYAGKITLDGDFLSISFEYDPDLVAAVKKIQGARFDGARRNWRVPITDVEAALNLPNFEVAPEVTARVESDRAAAKAFEEKERQIADKLLAATDHQLPSGRTLFKHQVDGVRWLLEKRRAILADDMGLGKSTSSLVAAKAFGLPIIVICPASLLINWQREAAIVGVDISVYSWAKIPKAPDHDFVLIADEAHYAQSLKSTRTKKLLDLAKSDHAMGVYLLTGTPLKNGRPTNLFPLLAAARHKLAANRSQYERRYCDAKETRWTRWDTSGASNLDELHRETRDVILRRLKKDCIDLPEKMRVIRPVELSDKAQEVYDATFEVMRKQYHERIEKGEITDTSEALVMLNHVRHAGSIAKAETAIETAQEVIEQGGQVVIFVAFKESGSQIAKALGCEMLSGDALTEERQQMVDDFQSGKAKALVCTFGAGGVGITLTAAQTVILVDRPWTPGDAEQSEDRLHRIGQRNAVTAIWLQCGETDEAIDALLQSKADRIELVLQGKRKTLRGVSSPGQMAQELLPALMG